MPASPAPSIDPRRIGRWSTAVRRLSWPLRRLWLDIEVDGAGNVPADGPVILAANHLSFIDSPVLMFETPRTASILGKAEYLDSAVTGALFPAAGMIPVDRSGRGVAWSMRIACDRLRAGEAVAIFPEGTRARDSLLHRGHPGVAHLMLRTGSPVVPVGIIGTDAVQPPGARIPRRAPITLRFGAPLDPGRWHGRRPTASTRREITDEVMAAIGALTGQPVVEDGAVPAVVASPTG